MEIRPLRKDDDRSSFTCGNSDLDDYFRKYAWKNQEMIGIGQTHVAIKDGRIAGFVTIASAQIESDRAGLALKKRFPSYPLPALRLARMGVEKSGQRQGVGKKLLIYVFKRTAEFKAIAGCIGLVVDAKVESRSFYDQFGFVQLEDVQSGSLFKDETVELILPTSHIEAVLSGIAAPPAT